MIMMIMRMKTMMNNKKYNFYDTSSLLKRATDLFDNPDEKIIISSITLEELEDIKTCHNKDMDVKYAARKLLHTIDENRSKIEIVIFRPSMLAAIEEKDLSINNDMKILACANWYNNTSKEATDDVHFITNDLALKQIANLFFGDGMIDSIPEVEKDEYLGYKEIQLSDEQLADFYLNITTNKYDLYLNQYLIIRNFDNEVIDAFKWNGKEHQHLGYYNFNSTHFGNVKPMKGDIYQTLLTDSLVNNKLTMVKGPAGSGKTYLSLAYYFSLLEKGKIDKIIIFCNTVATKNSAKLGFYPGTRDEKLLDSQIGNLLSSKLGSKMIVEELIESEKLVLLPLSDIRGYDTSDMNAGIYISEAQNLDISLMKLALQRIGEDSRCIIDGDYNAQVDMIEFAGANNGMRRVSKVFRDKEIYGEIALKNIYRSQIALIAEDL